MHRSAKLKNILNEREDLWSDSKSETSSISDNYNLIISPIKMSSENSETSSDENNELPRSCCLICSILPNLSSINSCSKHLALLTTVIKPTQVVYMMHPALSNCHCRSKSTRRCRSSSSSSSSPSSESSRSEHRRKKRSVTVESSDKSSQGDLFFSPNVQSQEKTNDNQQHQFNHVELPLSPSLPPSSVISTNLINNLQQTNDFQLTPFLHRNKQRTNNDIGSWLQNISIKPPEVQTSHQTISPDVIETDLDFSYSPRILLDRVVHVKDDGEILNNDDKKRIAISMAEATEQMQNQIYPQPVILLKRVRFEN